MFIKGEPEARRLWRRFREISIEEFKRLYSYLGVSFDSYDGESFYESRLPELVERLRRTGILVESQGAWIISLDAYNLPPALILKKDEATLYLTRDIAAAEYRFQTWHFARLLYVVGVPQKLHFQQLFATARQMGYDEKALELVHVSFGTVLGDDGRPFKTRAGDTVGLEGLLDEAVRRAASVVAENDDGLAAAQFGVRIGEFRF